jgi:hypothetical protein
LASLTPNDDPEKLCRSSPPSHGDTVLSGIIVVSLQGNEEGGENRKTRLTAQPGLRLLLSDRVSVLFSRRRDERREITTFMAISDLQSKL